MKISAMLRKMDAMGRVVIPQEIRRAMELEAQAVLELSLEEDRLIIKKFSPACIFCGGTENMVTYEGRNICRKCVQIIKNA